LNKLSIDLKALLFIQNQFWIFRLDIQQVSQVGLKPARLRSIWTTSGLHLKHSHIHSHLYNISPIIAFDESDAQRMWIERPVLEELI
jgi:hypothetical protein